MIRCVRMWTGPDGNSVFEEGVIPLAEGERGDFISRIFTAKSVYFRETAAGGSFSWHQDPEPRYVITLSGTLEFETKSGAKFIIRPGDILIAQDSAGSGHRWRLLDDAPWRRVYVAYDPATAPAFVPTPARS